VTSTLRDKCKKISSALAQQNGGSVVVMGEGMGVGEEWTRTRMKAAGLQVMVKSKAESRAWVV
jgi:hypothetical protein